MYLYIMLFGLPGGGEWAVIILLALLVFGAKRLPEIAKNLGAGLRNFKKGITEGAEDEEKKPKGLAEQEKIKVIPHEDKEKDKSE